MGPKNRPSVLRDLEICHIVDRRSGLSVTVIWHTLTRRFLHRRAAFCVRACLVLFTAGIISSAAPRTRIVPIDVLASQVTIYRDTFGVPHLVGETEEAAFFGYGYAQAEDHLERMMLEYRDAQGRRAEVDTSAAPDTAYLQFFQADLRWGGDYLQRLLRTKQAVVEHRAQIDPHVYRLLDAFARGVNSYIVENRAAIPSWIDAIGAEDVEALQRSYYMRFYSVNDALSELPGTVSAIPKFGSNQVAIAPSKSANGRIIQLEHSHMPWSNRFQLYEAHIIVPGVIDVAGVSWFGSPFFLEGFNDRITWSVTWNQPHIADIYEEQINPSNPLQYRYEGEWRNIQMKQETMAVRQSDGSLKTVPLSLYYTHHGPIIELDRKHYRAYSVRLPNFEGVNYSTGMYQLMQSHNLDEFRAALAHQLIPCWNFLYSDAKNIYWVHNGNVARRDERYNWRKPVPGWTSATEWGPYIPFSEYPQLLNPASGFLQNCNNPPWLATRNSGLRPRAPTPYYLQETPNVNVGEDALNPRGERVFQVIGQNRLFTVEEMINLGFDTHVMASDVIIPLLNRAVDAAGPEAGETVSSAMKWIRAWDGSSSESSIAYTYIYYWGRAYQDLFSTDSFGRFLSVNRHRMINIDSRREQAKALDALRLGLTRLEQKFGKKEVRWGKVNIAIRGGAFPVGGTGLYDVLHPDEGSEQGDGTIRCNDGWGHLMVAEEGDPKQVWTLLPFGESEHPESPHYNDQTRLHSSKKLKRFWFTPAEILAHTESVRGDKKRLSRIALMQRAQTSR
jgi:acyl-homoserine-lactone acylase